QCRGRGRPGSTPAARRAPCRPPRGTSRALVRRLLRIWRQASFRRQSASGPSNGRAEHSRAAVRFNRAGAAPTLNRTLSHVRHGAPQIGTPGVPMAELILIVDDDPVQRRLLEAMARRFGYEVMTADGGDAAVAALTGPDSARIDCVILDLVMPDLDGYGVLARMRDAGLTIPAIVQTAHGGIDTVVSTMRAGAVDFVVKPVGAERLQVSLRNALSVSALETEFQRLKRSRTGTLSFKDVVTRN